MYAGMQVALLVAAAVLVLALFFCIFWELHRLIPYVKQLQRSTGDFLIQIVYLFWMLTVILKAAAVVPF